ncbi:hypothetical protein R1sor_013858 [Riccia sorocarpa]|uniref:Uncharacterized protein n=1 Tax=Riccia sorocarpa TaxID=122646 RepID=A0ABD3HBL1_9MARC
MAPKITKKREKTAMKSSTKPLRSPTRITPTGPSSSSTPAKAGMCKYLALPTVALKEYQGRLEELGLGFLFWLNVGNPMYIQAFLEHLHMKNGWLSEEEKKIYGEDHPFTKISQGYSSEEDDSSSKEDQQPASPQILAAYTEDEYNDGTSRRGVQFTFSSDPRRSKSSTSPNYFPLSTQEPKGTMKKNMRDEAARRGSPYELIATNRQRIVKVMKKMKTKKEKIKASRLWVKKVKPGHKYKELLRDHLRLYALRVP